ncbi:MAG: hypothetical protein U9P70_01265 [Patescibacteria group bacterium]|nr:hypothetical protein [Patescibacteria group bacterium]
MQDFFKSLFTKFEITIGSTARSLPRTAMRGDYGANDIQQILFDFMENYTRITSPQGRRILWIEEY